MLKIFGHCIYFNFRHLIYEYRVTGMRGNKSLFVERITKENISQTDMGYFSVDMLSRVLKKNRECSEGFLFRESASSDVVGFVFIAYRGAREIHYKIINADAFIVAIGVMPSFRGKGFSQEILATVNDICFEKKMKAIKLAVDDDNTVAINSYEKFGFIKGETKAYKRFLGVDFLKNNRI